MRDGMQGPKRSGANAESMSDDNRDEQGGLRRAKARLKVLSERLPQLLPSHQERLFHIQRFIEGLKIINKQGEMVSLIMNRAQEIVFQKLMECRERRVPARFICCKSRSCGHKPDLQTGILS